MVLVAASDFEWNLECPNESGLDLAGTNLAIKIGSPRGINGKKEGTAYRNAHRGFAVGR